MNSQQELGDFFQNNLRSYIDMLRRMVEINSFTANPGGVNKLGNLTVEFFSKLGFKPEFVQCENPDFGKHLVLTHSEENNGAKNEKPLIALISHLDTVYPPEEEITNNFLWQLEGDRIYGPGTVDIKGGTVMIYMLLDALQTIYSKEFEQFNWMVFFNAAEEILSEDFGRLCKGRLPSNTQACLVFEGGALGTEDRPLVVARKGRAVFQVEVEGRSAHAGNYHAHGANAIVQMAHTVQTIASFTDYKRQVTFNVGTVKGGSVVNRVPHHAQASVEIRAFDSHTFSEGINKMMTLNGISQISSGDGYPCKVSIELKDQTAPWPRNETTNWLLNLWTEAASSIGMDVIAEERGGLSDGNWLWDCFPTLDGLGPSGANAHCSERSQDGEKDQEYVLISSFVPKALLNTSAVLGLIKESS
ncbi:M20/M25/M40 family metallo-hydrolase [Chloroflexota bacterium]